MTKPITDFSGCSLKRAIKAAHSLQLSVDRYEIAKDGALRIHVRNYRIDADGSVHALTVPLGDKLEELGLPTTTPAQAA